MKTSGGPAFSGGGRVGGGRLVSEASLFIPHQLTPTVAWFRSERSPRSRQWRPRWLAGVVPFERYMILNVWNSAPPHPTTSSRRHATILPAVARLISSGRLDVSSLTWGLKACGNISFFFFFLPITGSQASVSFYFRRVWDLKKNQQIRKERGICSKPLGKFITSVKPKSYIQKIAHLGLERTEALCCYPKKKKGLVLCNYMKVLRNYVMTFTFLAVNVHIFTWHYLVIS